MSEAITEEDRYVRGALGMGLTWAVGFIIVGNALNAFEWLFQGGATPNVPLGILLGASVGFIGGGVFSVALAVAGRRRRFDEMSLPRFAGFRNLWRGRARCDHERPRYRQHLQCRPMHTGSVRSSLVQVLSLLDARAIVLASRAGIKSAVSAGPWMTIEVPARMSVQLRETDAEICT